MAIAPGADASFLLEPFGRNTAPAVALGALYAQARGWDDAVLLVLPADHLIRDQAAFVAAVARAVAAGEARTAGHVRHRADASGNGLRLHRMRRDGRCRRRTTSPAAYRAQRFVEKPPLLTARAISRGRQLPVELGHVRVHAARDPRGVRAPRAGRRSPRRGRSPRACRRRRPTAWSRSTRRCLPRCPTSRSTTR